MKKANISFLACTSCNNIESAISDKGFSSSSPFLTHLTRSGISIELDVVEDSSGDFLMSSSIVGSFGLDRFVRKSANEATAGRGITAGSDEFVEAKIKNVGMELMVNEDVGGFNVAVNEFPGTAFVKVGQATSGSLCDFQPC
ncbi:hypothetical protein GOBAR_DD27239 [Gossypium barbadense]|nr:hypothetical protein GOBAR_DD27239 [Gossypium barbadense]